MRKIYHIYTDGSAAPNPGPGGFGVVVIEMLVNKDDIIEEKDIVASVSCICENTTNNQEEIKGMIWALNYISELKEKQDDVADIIIFCDSSYVVNMCNDWIWKWQANDWQKSSGEIKNLKLVMELYDCLSRLRGHNYSITYIKGHNGNPGNEYADALATKNAKKIEKYYDILLGED